MGVYIKGMEMPKENTMLWLYPDGNVRVWRQDIDHDEWKTAIEVPTPHGRLIDVDALDNSLGISDEDIDFHHMLEDAPTVIEEGI